MFFGVTSRSARGMSAAVALLAIGAVGCADAIDSAKDGAKKAVRTRSVFSLAPGDCYNPNSGATEGEELSVEIVPCDEAHKGQVVGEFDIEGKSKYPGDAGATEIADRRCPAESLKFIPDTWAIPKGVDLFYYYPTSESWKTGDRAVSCTYAKESGTFSGSLENKSLTADQVTYLKGSNAVYEALWNNQPEADQIEDDLAGYKKQAKAISEALDTHLAALKGLEQPQTAKLRSQLAETAEAWKDAASAGDTDDFYVAYDLGFTGIDPNRTVAARKELELATTVPADDAAAWAG
ncbi:septum formation family protein [Streptomyces sp. JH34]|uniref:septum formation family protein n=1 Tax=unclassified Streptomyces TaxID=2593676 RepID=UPI0023FA3B45|nr:septum formation family protein [Streptomyces sp. JH34]MDF6017718.1 septum formation family protein [Streptomyces sp. JH34]